MKRLCSQGFEGIYLKLKKQEDEVKKKQEELEEFDNPLIPFSVTGIESLLELRLVEFDNMTLSTTAKSNKGIIDRTRELMNRSSEVRKESKFEKSRNAININDMLKTPLESLENQLSIAHAIIKNIIEKKNFNNDIIFYLEYGPRFDLEISFHKYREYDKKIVEDVVNKDYLAAYYIIEEND